MKFPEKIQAADVEALLAVNGANTPFLDTLMFWMSDRFIWIPFYILLAILIWKIMGKKAILVFVFVGLMITVTDQVSTRLLKNKIERLRPCNDPELSDRIHRVNNKCGGSYGFVSSHAANTFALAAFISFILGRNRKWLLINLFIWAAVVSFSRIYLGVHYPLDVIGGALFGMTGALLFYYLYLFTKRKVAI